MTTILGNSRSLATVVLATAVFAGCVTGSFQEFDQTVKAGNQHRLYEPLAATPQGLLEQLSEVDLAPASVFHLSSMGAEPYTDPLTPELYWNEDMAVFFRIEDGEDEENPWLYFNGHKLRIETIQEPLARDGDLAPAADGAFSLYRSVPVRKGGVRLTADLDLFRYDFRVTPEGDLEATGYQRITRAKGADYQAVPIVTTERIVYIHHEKDEPRRLMVGDIYGGPPRPLFDNQDFDALFPTMLTDGRLVFVADLLGHYSLFQVENASEYIRELETMRAKHEETEGAFVFSEIARPFVYPFPRSEHEGKMLLASVSADGRPRPVLQTLPDRFDLDAVADHVRAHNPAVNGRRARYAAALLDAAQFKLNNWPSLDLGLSYDNAVSLFDNIPAVFTGDTVTRQILRVFAGLSQPLLDFRENNARTESALRDAAVANDLINKEISDRITEAAALYFEAIYLAQRVDIETEQLAVTGKRMAYYRSLRNKQEATRLQIMSTEQVRQGILSERRFDEERLAFLLTRLKEVMGLPLATEIELAYDARYDFDRYVLPPLEEAVHLAELNHPSIKVAENALASAFWQQTAGPAVRPRAGASGRYEHRNREFYRQAFTPAQAATVPESVSDEIVSLALTGQIPLASVKANRIHNQLWAEIVSSLRLSQDSEVRRVKTAMEEAYVDFRAAQRDLTAKRSSQSYFLEKLRVTRLHREYGPPGATLELLRPPDEPGAVEDRLGSGVLAPLTAEFEYLRALDKSQRVEMDLGLRFAKVWREMGLIERLTDEGAAFERSQRDRRRPATWLWKSKDHLQSDDAIDELIDGLRARGVRRVYVYLYSDARIFNDRHDWERMTLLTELCAQWDIEVWALLGEPEWIEENDTGAVARSIRQILNFNAGFARFEPKIAGVKFDLEPHSLPGWETDAPRRQVLETNYRILLETAKRELAGGLPLWADLPTKFFREEEAELLSGLRGVLDGATVMSYFSNEDAIFRWSATALDAFEKPLEIGIEFSAGAPAEDTVAAWSKERVQAFEREIYRQFGQHEYYAGMAFHDYGALVTLSNRE